MYNFIKSTVNNTPALTHYFKPIKNGIKGRKVPLIRK